MGSIRCCRDNSEGEAIPCPHGLATADIPLARLGGNKIPQERPQELLCNAMRPILRPTLG